MGLLTLVGGNIFPYTNSMRKLLFLLIFAALVSPAQANRLHHAIQQQIVKSRITDNSPYSTNQALIRRALNQVVNRPLRTLTWEQFLQESNELQRHETINSARNEAFVNDLYNLDCDLLLKFIDSKEQKIGHPDYAKETQGIKYIYLGEHHNTNAIPTEVEYFLTTLRQANPNARILLATEFATREKQENSPILFANPEILTALQNDTYQFPFLWPFKHRFLFSTAIKLGIDVLALEDEFTYPGPEVRVKLGNALVTADPHNPQIAKILQQYHRITPSDTAQEILSDFLARTDWGMVQRNMQWILYLQTVSPFYDIIVTYAGEAHFNTSFASLPESLSNGPYIHFDFSTDEQLSEYLETFYRQCSTVQEDNTGKAPRTPIVSEDQINFLRQNISSDMSVEAFRTSYQRQLKPDYDEGDLQELNRLFQQHFHTNWQTDSRATHFQVSLPANAAPFQETLQNWKENLNLAQQWLENIKDPKLQDRYTGILQSLRLRFARITTNTQLSPTEKTAQLDPLKKNFDEMDYIWWLDLWASRFARYQEKMEYIQTPDVLKQCEEITETLRQHVSQIIQNEQLSFEEKANGFLVLDQSSKDYRDTIDKLQEEEWWNRILTACRSWIPHLQDPALRKEYKKILDFLERQVAQIIQNKSWSNAEKLNKFYALLDSSENIMDKMNQLLEKDGVFDRAQQQN